MVLKTELNQTVTDVLEEHDAYDGDLATDLVDRLSLLMDVYDDEEEADDEELPED